MSSQRDMRPKMARFVKVCPPQSHRRSRTLSVLLVTFRLLNSDETHNQFFFKYCQGCQQVLQLFVSTVLFCSNNSHILCIEESAVIRLFTRDYWQHMILVIDGVVDSNTYRGCDLLVMCCILNICYVVVCLCLVMLRADNELSYVAV